MRLLKTQRDSEIPTSSMADIAFLLIIFFMVTAVFSATRGLDLELPRNNATPPTPDPAVLIHVEADGSILVNCQPMRPDEILSYLEPRLLRNPDKPVILYTDPAAEYQAMVTAYDTLGSATQETHGFEVKNLSVPTASEVQGYIGLFGLNPFESRCTDRAGG
jgi:biopolymer transport protein ExbD